MQRVKKGCRARRLLKVLGSLQLWGVRNRCRIFLPAREDCVHVWWSSVKLLWGHQLVMLNKYAKERILNEISRLQLQDEPKELVLHT